MKKEKSVRGSKPKEISSKESTTNKRTVTRPKLPLSQLGIMDNLYLSVLHNAMNAFFITDNLGNIVEVNDAFCRMEGYSRDELLSMRLQDLDIEFIKDPYKFEQLQHKFSQDFINSKGRKNSLYTERKHRRKDGRIIYVEVNYHYLGPDLDLFFNFNRDITERKHAEEKLRESKEFVENLLASMKDGFSVLDDQGVHIKVSDSLCQMTGFTRAELIGTGLPHLYWLEEEYERAQEAFKEAPTEDFGDKELIFKRKNGERFPVILSPSCLKDDEGNIVSYFATIKDITERKQAEKAREESEQKYRDLYDNAPVAYLSVNTDGLIIRSNHAAQDWLGYSGEELKDKKFLDIYAEESRPKAKLISERFKQGQIIDDEEMVYLSKGKKKVYGLLSVNPIIDADGCILASRCVVRDITERKKLQDSLMLYQNHLEDIVKKRTSELTKTNKKLERLYQKEKELRAEIEEGNKRRIDFISALVHEIKTPFTPMIGASDMLVNILEDEKLLRIAKNINRGAHSLNNRINDLMDMVSGEAGLIKLEHQNIDPLYLLSETIEDMKLEANRKRQLLTLDICSPLPKIYGDSDRLRQVLLNLLNNALKFTPEEGEITVSAEAKDDNLVISVSDTGCGIAKEDQRLLFERRGLFNAGRMKPSSLGLGLPLSKLLVELHGGKIWVNSKKGSGSIFSFSVPIKASS